MPPSRSRIIRSRNNNDRGRELAIVTAKALADIEFDIAYSSPLSRAYETAEIILRYSHHPIPEIITDERIKEICFGEWEGKGITKENFSIPSERFNEFYTDTFNFPNAPGGETTWEVVHRTGEFLIEVFNNPDYQDKRILVVTHGFALRALLHHVYEEKNDFWHGHVPANCCLNVIEKKGDGLKLVEEDQLFYNPDFVVNPYREI